MKQISKKQQGFTLIEVVLVLAIGGLIILLALLAFSGASRARRDTARQNGAGTLLAAVEQYASNNGGSYPPDQTALNSIATKSMLDPRSNLSPQLSTTAAVAGTYRLVLSTGYKCNGTGITASAANFAITYALESGQVACKDNL